MRSCRQALFIATAGLLLAAPAAWAAKVQNRTQETAGPAAPVPLPPGAMSRVPCGQRDAVVKMLRDSFGETQIAQGLANTGAMAEVFISAKGTWTIIATGPNGVTCMVGSGESWEPAVAHDGTI
jgi:hypothetical protein